MRHANEVHPGSETSQLGGSGLLLRRHEIRGWLNGESIPTAEVAAESAPAREADDARDVLHVLLFGLVMLVLLLLVRNVRVGLPGDFPAPAHAAVRDGVAPLAWKGPVRDSGLDAGLGTFGADRGGDRTRSGR